MGATGEGGHRWLTKTFSEKGGGGGDSPPLLKGKERGTPPPPGGGVGGGGGARQERLDEIFRKGFLRGVELESSEIVPDPIGVRHQLFVNSCSS